MPDLKQPPAPPAVRGAILGLVVVVIAGVCTAAGIGIWKLTADSSSESPSPVSFPDFIFAPDAPTDTLTAYQAAVDHYDEFGEIPCYCGCGPALGHQNLAQCFIASHQEGDIVFEQHASG